MILTFSSFQIQINLENNLDVFHFALSILLQMVISALWGIFFIIFPEIVINRSENFHPSSDNMEI